MLGRRLRSWLRGVDNPVSAKEEEEEEMTESEEVVESLKWEPVGGVETRIAIDGGTVGNVGRGLRELIAW